MPNSNEMSTRAKRLNSSVMTGELLHNDYAKYQLSLEANVYGGRPVLGSAEMEDVIRRIHSYQSGPVIRVGNISDLPDELKYHVGDHPVYKIEWFFNGRYGCTVSMEYSKHFMTEEEILGIARKYGIPPKLVDSMGLNDHEMAYKMWVESLFSPGICVTYTGSGYWRGDNQLLWSTARVMSVIVNHEYLITATTVGRGTRYVVGSAARISYGN